MKRIIVPVLCFLLMFQGVALQGQDQEPPAYSRKPVFLRFNFLGLVDAFDNNFSIGLEKPFSAHGSVILDAGWVFHSESFRNATSSNGILLRPAIRLYPRKEGRGFVETELHYKSVTYKIEDWVGRDCVNGVPAYDEFTTFKYRKHSYGFHLRAGVKGALDREKQFWLEFSGGLGVRWRYQGLHREPGSCYNRVSTFFITDGPNPSVISVVPLTLRALYRFGGG